MKKNMNLFFLMLLIMSTLMIMMSSMWLNMWIYMEINLMSFIFLMMNFKNYLNLETSLIYFLIQTIASILLLFSLIFLMIFYNMMVLMMMALFLKLGIAPLHFWLIMIINKLNWLMIYLLLTFQKISPLILFYQYNNMNLTIIFMILSLMIGSFYGLNYSSLKKIMAYSSINQLSWIIMAMYLMNKLFKLYFLMYMYIMIMIIYSFNYFNYKFIFQIINYKNKYINLFIFCNMLSLGGLPPFIGFFPKLMIINYLNNSIFLFMMVMFTMITLFYYIRIIMSFMMINSWKLNILMKKNKFKLNILMKLSMFNNLMMMMLILIY